MAEGRSLMRHAWQCLAWAILIALCLFVTGLAQDSSQTGRDKTEEFALELVKAKSEQERHTLLAANKELMTAALRRELVRHGNVLLMEGKYGPAFDIYVVAQNIATQIGDEEGMAAASLDIGTVYYFQG